MFNQPVYTNEQWKVINSQIEFIKNNSELCKNKIMLSNKWEHIKKNDFMFKDCHASKYMLNISADGNITTCCHVSENPKYFIGNINDIKDINHFRELHKFKIESLKNKGFNPECCPIACRGFGINQAIESFDRKHLNFI